MWRHYWNITRSVTCRFGAVLGAMLVVILLCDKARPDDGLVFGVSDDVQNSRAEELWLDWSDSGNRFWSDPPGPLALTVDWRVLSMFNSHTSYQFGTPPGYYRGNYAPLSKLDWSLDSTWTGFRIGAEEADSAGHFEWLTPMGRVSGNMEDFDWSGPDRPPFSLSSSSERWNEGQMLDLEYEFRLLKRPLGLPVDLWPLAGFRWQRFDITGANGVSNHPARWPIPTTVRWRLNHVQAGILHWLSGCSASRKARNQDIAAHRLDATGRLGLHTGKQRRSPPFLRVL